MRINNPLADNAPADHEDQTLVMSARAFIAHLAEVFARSDSPKSAEHDGLDGGEKLNSNCRYRFLNCQTTASCYNL